MGIPVFCSHIGAPRCSISHQLGTIYSKGLDPIGPRAKSTGDFFGGSFSTSLQPHPATAGPFLGLEGCQRTNIRQLLSPSNRFAFVEGDTPLISHGRGQRDSGKKKVRSFVDEATAHSSDLEVSGLSCISDRSDGEAAGPEVESDEFRKPRTRALAENGSGLDQKGYCEPEQVNEEGEEYGPGIQTIEAKSSSLVNRDYNYEDMKLAETKNWSMYDIEKIDRLRDFESRHSSEKGVFVVQTMRVEHIKATEELLVDSFAELMGGLLTYRPLLALTVKQYLRDRYACLPDAVTLVGLYAPAEDNVAIGMTENNKWLLAGTVELSFSNAGHPEIPAGPAPPSGSPYLCNMAVSSTYRRRGLGRQLLKAAEELAVSMGAQDLYLHCRIVDVPPLNMYQAAGYEIVATDSILSLLSFQRRRHLMRKRLQAVNQ